MKWYLHPQGIEFDKWSPSRFKLYVKNVSFAVNEPEIAPMISVQGWALYPLTDDGAQPPANKTVASRSITLTDDYALAVYTYRNMNAVEHEAVHQDKCNRVNAERDRRIVAGKSFDVSGYTTVPLTGREKDKVALMGLLIKAQGAKALGITSPVIKLRDGEDVNHWLTPDQAIELIDAGMNWIEAIMARSWDMKDRVGVYEEKIPDDLEDDSHWMV